MRDYNQVLSRLEKAKAGAFHRNEPLRRYSSWHIGGPADILIEPRDEAGLKKIIRITTDYGLPVVIIGCGTNLLFDDAGVRGVVVKIGERMSGISISGTHIRAGAGAWMPRLAQAAGRAGLTGLEHTIGIPGTVGGLVVMNGGSLHKSIGENVRRLTVMDREGRSYRFSHQDCHFAYRSSLMRKEGLIVTEVELECKRGEKSVIRREMLEILRERNRKFPRKTPNCGSVFLSGPELYERFGPPGKIIEETGLKGLSVGDAQVSGKHANFIINRGRATSDEVLELIRQVREAVYRRIGVRLECEVRYVSPDGSIIPAHLVKDYSNGFFE